ncbi:MAG: dihydrodipicolinate reductase C-terminal domain-containing protein [Acidobacteriota bacterium]|jgi:4-hydroxy-tetrahydrodipicolinate reductase|nr:dihydrodipicolinate reductase C-terminal domain-containing protein [Acidobacteriota bacterium]NLT34009.1 dihydrodipicolinate reductase [Acidobacteriota bacterium]
MRIALLGYGKMGKMVEAIAVREGWDVGPRLDIEDNPGGRGITADSMKGVDVAVEFSQPEAVMANIEAAARAGVNLVVGTTGWMAGRERAERLVADSGIGLIHGANFSPGMNLFFEIVAHASRLVGSNLRYDSFMMEEHHREKKDAPSGTALDLRDLMRPHLGDRDLSITSVRAGFIPGTHVIGFDSEADTLLLEHRARNRQGFAEGAFLAARWIVGKKGMYDFRRVFREIVGQP